MLTHNTRLAENKDFYLPKIKKYIYAWSISVIIIIVIIIIILHHRELSQMLSIKFLLLLNGYINGDKENVHKKT